jgi:agmatinase
VSEALSAGKLPVVVGGDHSAPFGAIQACSERFPGMGLLHFDAHADLRKAYEGFEWSHASILFNATMRLEGVARVVQVGVRDLCEEEWDRIRSSGGRIATLFDTEWARVKLSGKSPEDLIHEWIDRLPGEVYVTFDVDGLDPTLCPNTGTPVPGGLLWHEAMAWLQALSASGRRVVGLDLNEVNPGPGSPPRDGARARDSMDSIVGARLLYRLIGTALKTKG